MKVIGLFIFSLVLVTGAAADPVLTTQQAPANGTLVRLPDGRLAVYDSDPSKRTLCANDCGSDTIEATRPGRRAIVLTALAGGIVFGAILLRAGTPDKQRIPGMLPPAIFATPIPESPVPEFSTLVLLGSGLALLARRMQRLYE